MRRWTTSALAGFAYGSVLLLWALFSAGFGHGTYLPFGLVGSPISPFVRFGFAAAPFWWAGIGYAIGRRATVEALLLLALHALGAAVCLARGTPWESLHAQWVQLGYASRVIPFIVWPGFAFYLAGFVAAFVMALPPTEMRE